MTKVKLTDLNPTFLKWIDDRTFQTQVSFAEADGLMFLCPKCFRTNGGPVGTESIICWKPNVPQTTDPVPGRWDMRGTGFSDLTLSAGSSSILIKDHWHGYVTDGEVLDA